MSATRKNKFKVKRDKRNGDLRKATGDHESNASSDRTCAAHISWNLRSRDSEVESKVDNPSERLYFLGQYTSGKAKVLIKGCLQMRSEDSYEVAG